MEELALRKFNDGGGVAQAALMLASPILKGLRVATACSLDLRDTQLAVTGGERESTLSGVTCW